MSTESARQCKTFSSVKTYSLKFYSFAVGLMVFSYFIYFDLSYIEFLKLLPFGVLHRLFAQPPTSALIATGGAGSGGASLMEPSSPLASPTESTAGQLSSSSVGSLDTSAHGEGGGLGLNATALLAAAGMAGIASPVEGAMRLATDPVGERCLSLLLVLLHNRRYDMLFHYWCFLGLKLDS